MEVAILRCLQLSEFHIVEIFGCFLVLTAVPKSLLCSL